MAAVALQHGDHQRRGSFLLDLDAGDGAPCAARIAGLTLITIVVVGVMALWLQPLAHADHLHSNDASLTVFTLPVLHPPALGVRLPFHLETGPAAAVHWLEMTTIVSAAPDIQPATGDTVTIHHQAIPISGSFGLHSTQDPIA